MIVQSFLFASQILVITKSFVFHFIRTWTIVKKIYYKYSLVEQDAPTHAPLSCRNGRANKVTSVALTRDYNNIQHKFPPPGRCWCVSYHVLGMFSRYLYLYTTHGARASAAWSKLTMCSVVACSSSDWPRQGTLHAWWPGWHRSRGDNALVSWCSGPWVNTTSSLYSDTYGSRSWLRRPEVGQIEQIYIYDIQLVKLGFILYFEIDDLVSLFRVPDTQCVL